MAFCKKCGAQVGDFAPVCGSCGEPRVPSTAAVSAAASSAVAAVRPQEMAGFFGSLFDLSFTNFITTKLVKVIYILCLAGAALMALFIAFTGLYQGGFTGILMAFLLAPLGFLLGVMYSRVMLEIVIVVFRMAEHLGEIAQRGRSVV